MTQQLDPLLVQLRAFGAAEYSLQRWGPDAVMYRFHCDMPLAAGAQLTEQFEAIASTPQAAVQQVLHEVAAWSANRQALAASKRLASR